MSKGVKRGFRAVIGLVAAWTMLLASPANAGKASSKPPAGGGTSRPEIQLMSSTPSGASDFGGSGSDISSDGRYVAFSSWASNLVSGDTNGTYDVFVRDRATGTTERVSVGADGAQLAKGGLYASISADGRYVAFASADPSLNPPSLVPNEGLSPPESAIIRDRQLGTTTLVSRNNDTGARAAGIHPSISDNGCRVAYETISYWPNPIHERYSYLYDCTTGKVTRVGPTGAYEPAISGDGRFVAYTEYNPRSDSRNATFDGPGVSVAYRLEVDTGIIQRVAVNNSGEAANSDSVQPDISRDGSKVVFTSWATNLGGGSDSTVYLRDFGAGTTKVVSVNSSGQPADYDSAGGALSPDGTHVAFISSARNLTANANGWQQVYLHSLATGQTSLLSYGLSGKPANYPSWSAAASAGGAVVAFDSNASDLVRNDTNATSDVFAAIK